MTSNDELEKSAPAQYNHESEKVQLPELKVASPSSADSEEQPSPSADVDASQDGRYIQGWRLYTITLALCMSFFIASLEVTIVATSLVAIVDDLHNFDQSSWIINAYMLAFTGFIIIWAKLSDIYGRKLFIVLSVLIFVIFSAACGAAQTTSQLIAFRALQGFGGSGTYSLTLVLFNELVPPHRFASYASGVSMVLGLAMLLGPLFGGAITNGTTWRWVFLINVPIGCAVAATLIATIPNRFPHHHLPDSERGHQSGKQRLSLTKLKRTDMVGTALLLASTVLLVASMEQAGLGHRWQSAVVLVLLIVSVLLWVLFTLWERRITLKSGTQEPVFPWRFMQSAPRIGVILTDFLLGGPFTVCMIQIPQRFQTVHHLSSLDASVRLLPFGLFVTFGTFFGIRVAGRAKIPPVYIILIGSVVQVVGFVLLSTTPHSESIHAKQYGYQIIAGMGVGLVLGILVTVAPFTVEDRDKSVAMSAIVQFRTMGGAVFLAIASSVFLNFVRSRLAGTLSPLQVDGILKSTQAIALLTEDERVAVTQVLSKGYNLQFRILIGLAAAQFPAGMLLWRREQILV